MSSRVLNASASLKTCLTGFSRSQHQGLFSPDREPHPAVQELKYLQQPVAFKVAPSQNNRTVSLNVNDPPVIVLDVVNRYTFREMDLECDK